ncbi:MAG: hypothetical protein ACJ8R9_21845 [Steroidobacteraceae bacterium]
MILGDGKAQLLDPEPSRRGQILRRHLTNVYRSNISLPFQSVFAAMINERPGHLCTREPNLIAAKMQPQCQRSVGNELDFILDFIGAGLSATHSAQGPRVLAGPHVARWVAGQPPVLNPSTRQSLQLWL